MLRIGAPNTIRSLFADISVSAQGVKIKSRSSRSSNGNPGFLLSAPLYNFGLSVDRPRCRYGNLANDTGNKVPFLLGSLSGFISSSLRAEFLAKPGVVQVKTGGLLLMQHSDEQRWSAFMMNAQLGNESDYRELLIELADAINYYLRSRFGNNDFVEDCVQETLIAVHQARHTYNPQRPFRPWLFSIVRHKAIDTLRKQHSQRRLVEQYQGYHAVMNQGDSYDAAETDISEGRLLKLLSAEQREPLILTKIIGFSVAEAAKKLGISESSVKVRVHRAIRKLRKLMEAEER